jgi:hypothetical protein
MSSSQEKQAVATDDVFRRILISDAFHEAQTSNRALHRNPRISDKCMQRALESSCIENCAAEVSARRGHFVSALARRGNAVIEDIHGKRWILLGVKAGKKPEVIECAAFDEGKPFHMGKEDELTFEEVNASQLVGEDDIEED